MIQLHSKILTVAMVLSAIIAGPANAQVGEVVAVSQSATATNDAGTRPLEAGATVDIGDLIETNRGGLVQIRFIDDTKLVVGNNSKLTIEAYLLDANNTVRDMTLNALGGSYRFFTGRSPKRVYSIRTAVATIGVRGTQFDWTSDEASTSVVNFAGFPFLTSNADPSVVVLVRRLCFPTTMRADSSFEATSSVAVRNEQIIRGHPLIRKRQASFAAGFGQPIRVCGDLRRVNSQPNEDSRGNESTPDSPSRSQQDVSDPIG